MATHAIYHNGHMIEVSPEIMEYIRETEQKTLKKKQEISLIQHQIDGLATKIDKILKILEQRNEEVYP